MFESLPPDNVREGITSMFSRCPSSAFVNSVVCPFVWMILLSRYLMNGLSSLNKTYMEYSLAPADDLIRFRKSKVKVKVTADNRGHILWTPHLMNGLNNFEFSIQLTGNIHQPLLMTWLDSGGKRSKSQQAMVKASVSTHGASKSCLLVSI